MEKYSNKSDSRNKNALNNLEQNEHNAGHNITNLFEVTGSINCEALEDAYLSVMKKKEWTALLFAHKNGGLINKTSNIPVQEIEVIDLRDRDQSPLLNRELLDQKSGGKFPEVAESLVRVTLFQKEDGKFLCLFCMFGSESDHNTLDLFVKQVFESYRENNCPDDVDFTVIGPLQGDFPDHENKKFGQLEHEKYWNDLFTGELPVLNLPSDNIETGVNKLIDKTCEFELPGWIKNKLQSICSEYNAPLHFIFQAMIKVLFHIYSGQNDIVIGTYLPGEKAVGCRMRFEDYNYKVALRDMVDGQDSLCHFFKNAAVNFTNADQHKDYPFHKMIDLFKWSSERRSPQLFDVMVNYYDDIDENTITENLEKAQLGGDDTNEVYGLNFHFYNKTDGLKCVIHYKNAQYHTERIKLMILHFNTLVEEVISNPRGKIGELSILSGKEKIMILEQYNDTGCDFPAHITITQMFEEKVIRSPDNTAVIFKNQRLTYQQLNEQANITGHYLLEHFQLKPDEPVGVMLNRSEKMIITILGILKASCPYLPVDPGYSIARKEFIFKDSRVKVVISDSKTIADHSKDYPYVTFLDINEVIKSSSKTENPLPGNNAENLAYIIYTSGSTGVPKGTLIEHRALVNRLVWMQKNTPINARDTILQKTTYTFDVSVWEMFWWSLYGAAVCFLEPGGEKEPALITEAIEKYNITTIHFVPSMYHAFLEYIHVNGSLKRIKSLKSIFCSGEALTVQLVEKSSSIMIENKTQLINLYGPTEAAIDVTYYHCKPGDRVIPIGKPISNIQLYILDNKLNPVATGCVGELFISGAGLARGYLNRPELTAVKFIENPFVAGEKMYRTGDLARWMSCGNIEYLGRIDNQIKIRGFRVELGEIEFKIGEIENISEVIVHMKEKEGEKYLCTYYVANLELAGSFIHDYLSQFLPDYMVPTFYIQLDKIPLAANGKADRKALPDPVYENLSVHTDYAEAGNKTEKKLLEIWREILGFEKMGINDNFFNLGCHSLKATKAVLYIQKETGAKISLKQIFSNPSVAALAKTINPEELCGNRGKIKLIANDVPKTLSPGQNRIWVLSQLNPAGYEYNEPLVISMKGEPDLAALSKALLMVIDKHQILQTRYAVENHEPVQIVDKSSFSGLKIIDACRDGQMEKGEVEKILLEEIQKPFELHHKAPMRAVLLKTAPGEHIFAVVFHHIAMDGYSLNIFVEELARFYSAITKDEQFEPGQLPVQYADFSVWQNTNRPVAELVGQLGYWKKKLQGISPVALPIDKSRPAVWNPLGKNYRFTIDAGTARRFNEKIEQQNSTLFTRYLSLFKILLSYFCRAEDIAVGIPSDGRDREETEEMIGFFINNLVIRSDISGDTTYRGILSRVQDTILDALANQDIPFDSIVKEVEPERDLSYNPLFQVSFGLETKDRLIFPDMHGMEASLIEFDSHMAKFDLHLEMQEQIDGSFHCFFQYPVSLFDEKTIQRMSEYFQRLITIVSETPDGLIADYKLLSQSEQQQIVYTNNRTGIERDPAFIHELFESRVKASPGATAVLYEDILLNYDELNVRANQIAHYLLSKKIEKETRVAVLVTRNEQLPAILLGIMKAGAVYVPLDPAIPSERLNYILLDTGAKYAFTNSETSQLVKERSIKRINLDEVDGDISAQCSTNPGLSLSPDQIAYIIYTSGSTGKPKGVMVPHKGICNRVIWVCDQFKIGCDDRMLQKTNIAFDAAGWEFYAPLVSGGSVVIAPDPTVKDPGEIVQLTASYQVTILQFVPSLLSLVIEEPVISQCTALRYIFSAGEPLSLNLCNKINSLLDVQIINTYGPTEYSIDATWWSFSYDNENQRIPIGRPLDNTRIYILDEKLRPVPPGVAGELYISGRGLARGYLNKPGLTARSFIPNPFSAEKGARMYKTGDLARFNNDNQVEFIGRIDEQVKIRGFRIEIGEIEAVLASHEYIRSAAVLVVEPKAGDKRLVGYVAADGEEKLTTAAIHEHAARWLPDYMVPDFFVFLEQMPVTTSGKINRKALPLPDFSGGVESEEYVAAESEQEKVIQGIWQDVLNLERVSVTANFFRAGGNSLLAIQVLSRLRQLFKCSIPTRSMFEYPMVRAFTSHLEKVSGTGEASIPKRSSDDELELSEGQKQLWFLDQLQENCTDYLVPYILKLGGVLDYDALFRAVHKLMERHEILRTRYISVEGKPRQVIDQNVHMEPLVVDLSSKSEEEREESLASLMHEQIETGFDLENEVPVRVMLIKTGENEHLFYMMLHHIATDAWSFKIISRELTELYNSIKEGRTPALEQPVLQYGDYAVWQHKKSLDESEDSGLEYWKEQLAGLEPVTLYTERSVTGTGSNEVGAVKINMNNTLPGKVKDFAAEEGATLFMVYLAAFQVLLSRYTHLDDIAVGSPAAGRDRVETESLIGYFINTLVLRCDLSGDPGFREIVNRVKKTALDAFSNQDISFDRIVREVKAERDGSTNPLFSIMFLMEDKHTLMHPDLEGLEIEEINIVNKTSGFDLCFQVTEYTEDNFAVEIEYLSGLYSKKAMEKLGQHLLKLLEEAIAKPALPVASLDYLGDLENRLLVENRSLEYPLVSPSCFHQQFEELARECGCATAVMFNEKLLTYREVNEKANQLAGYIRSKISGDENVVGVVIDKSEWVVIVLLAVFKAGGTYLPIDPNLPAERVTYILKDTGAPLVITNERLAAQFIFEGVETVNLDRDVDCLNRLPVANRNYPVSSRQLAYIIYTSGSTGKPKGVMIEHHSFHEHCRLIIGTYGIHAESRVLQLASLAFDASLDQMGSALMAGAVVVVAGYDLWSPDQFPSLVEKYRVNVMDMTPAYYREIMENVDRADPRLKSIEQINVGADVVSIKDALDWIEGDQAGVFANTYGPTETTIACMAYPVTAFDLKDKKARDILPLGSLVAGCHAYILDENMNPVPNGVPGVLYVGGTRVGRGYYNRPGLTAQKFLPDLYSEVPGNRMYSTGDLCVCREDGVVEFMGRIDFQVKINGLRIELGEIESTLNGHPDISSAAVVVCESQLKVKKIVCYYILKKRELTGEDFAEYCSRFLPRYMVPQVWVPIENMPMTASGKINRKLLPEPDLSVPGESNAARVMPSNETELAVYVVWKTVLNKDEFGVYDNFFEVGGHSLKAIRVAAKLSDLFGVELKLTHIFEASTISGLANKILELIELEISNLSESELEGLLE